MKEKQYTVEQEQIARFAKAMGHPARMAILSFLAKQESCFFGDIHEELPIAKATVSQHLKELKDAGLIQGEIETPKVRYCINKENWEVARKLFAAFLGLVHLSEYHGGLIDNAGLLHLIIQVISFTGTLAYSGKYRIAAVLRGDVPDQLLVLYLFLH